MFRGGERQIGERKKEEKIEDMERGGEGESRKRREEERNEKGRERRVGRGRI